MYKNDTTNGSNGHGRAPLTRLTDMGVEVVDAPDSTADERTQDSGALPANDQNRGAAQTVSERAGRQILGEEDAPASLELLNAEDKRGRKRRFVLAAGVVIGLLVLLVGVGYFWLSSPSRDGMAYRVKSPAPAANAEKAGERAQGITAEEIARELRKPDAAGGGATGQKTNSTTNEAASSGSPVTDRLPNEDYSATVAATGGAAQQTTGSVAATGGTTQTAAPLPNATSGSAPEASANGSSFTTEHSIHVSASQSGQADGAHLDSNQTSPAKRDENKEVENSSANVLTKPAVPLPPLGTMLPVRTLGTVFTLRSDSYVRLELTRGVSGRGWSLPRGTEFYGTVRGAELETGRAYVALFGFVDRDTNRLVRLEGNLLGGDGADGVRGRRHKLNSGWAGALKKAGAGAIDVLSAVAAGVGRRPVVIGDVYGSAAPRVVGPIAGEIGGVTSTGDARGSGFVEVPAGTTGYILVTTIPKEVQGVDADARLAAPELRRLSNANVPLDEARLSEQEVAELLTSGSDDDIRRALPRMTIAMRRVAESYLANK
jgi:hypothetical protein